MYRRNTYHKASLTENTGINYGTLNRLSSVFLIKRQLVIAYKLKYVSEYSIINELLLLINDTHTINSTKNYGRPSPKISIKKGVRHPEVHFFEV
jgi:hypothetical protein